jgi:crotonobetainyl-CoA:carnitine CoA-transferase CaiB-like acyl-CoA transferase
MAGALDGIRVLDLSRVLAGPWATQLLGDLGATITKVEHPDGGDDTRRWDSPSIGGPQGAREAAYFLAANRGKQSICIDIAHPEGQALVRAMAAEADVLVENFKVGGLARYGLDAASMRALNPRLIYCSITGFGQDGPRAEQAGYDFVIQGMGGMMSVTGESDGQPLKAGVALADIVTGLYAANAITAALLARERTGEGQQIDIALFDTQVAMLANQALNFLATGRSPGRLGNAHPNIAPYQAFPTRDGAITIAVGNDRQFRSLCAVIGDPELSADARFASNAGRVADREALALRIGTALLGGDSADWIAALDRETVPAGAINTIGQAFADPQARHRGLALSLPHGTLGSVPGVACPIRLSGTPVRYRHGPPALGEHGAAILRAMGKDDGDIAKLAARGIVRLPRTDHDPERALA